MKIIPVGVSYDYEGLLGVTPVLPNGIRVFDGDIQIGVDDGVGGFVNTDSAYTVSGVIDYINGVIGINISPTPSGVVSVRYQQNEFGDIKLSKNQICKLNKVDIVSISYI